MPKRSKTEPPTMCGWNENTAKKDTSKGADHSRWFGSHKPFQNDFKNKEKWREEVGNERYAAHLDKKAKKFEEMEKRRHGK